MQQTPLTTEVLRKKRSHKENLSVSLNRCSRCHCVPRCGFVSVPVSPQLRANGEWAGRLDALPFEGVLTWPFVKPRRVGERDDAVS
ncbi:unnamed protein product, partial [Iphiclides podalirius]